jgi:hypothetical protein
VCRRPSLEDHTIRCVLLAAILTEALMSFLEKAKLAATGLAAKADVALTNAGMNPGGPSGTGGSSRDADRLLRDLGVLTLRAANGDADPAAQERVLGSLRQLQASGQLTTLLTSDQAPPPPPPPGSIASPYIASAYIASAYIACRIRSRSDRRRRCRPSSPA